MKTAMPTNAIQPTAEALARRIKRHLIGRLQSFYAVTAPGLEAICRRELEAHLEGITVEGTEKGGVAFAARLHAVYSANLHCRTAHRILMRVGRFRAAHFDALVANAGINIHAANGVVDGTGRFGYVIWVNPADYDKAAEALTASDWKTIQLSPPKSR